MFRQRSLKRVEGSIRERKAEAHGNEVSGLFSRIFVHLRHEMRAQVLQAVVGPACRQLQERR